MPLDPKDVGRYIFDGDQKTKRAPKTPHLPFDPSRSPYGKSLHHASSRHQQHPSSASHRDDFPTVGVGSFTSDRRDASVVTSPGKGTHVSLGVPEGGEPKSLQPSDWLRTQAMKDPALTPHETGAKEVSQFL